MSKVNSRLPAAQMRNNEARKAERNGLTMKAVIGQYIPMTVLVMTTDNRLRHHHLPQKLFALKDFHQQEALFHYHLHNPQQPVHVNEHAPNIGAFNGAVVNFHHFLIDHGYCRVEGGTDVTSTVWTWDEVVAANDEKARIKEELRLIRAAASGQDLDALKALAVDGHWTNPRTGEVVSVADVEARLAEGNGALIHSETNTLIRTEGRPDLLEADTESAPAFIHTEELVGRVMHADPAVEAAMQSATLMANTMAEVRNSVAPQPVEVEPEVATVSLEEMEAKFADPHDIHNNDVAQTYTAPAISAAELLAADPKGGL